MNDPLLSNIANNTAAIADNLIALRRQTAISAGVDPREMLRVLVVSAAPVSGVEAGSAPPKWLNLRAEWLKLAQAVRDTPAPIALIRCIPPTLDRLRIELGRQMREQNLAPQVVHFAGHGSAKGLLFENEWGRSEPVPTARLIEIFKDAGVQLFVANACSSAEDVHAAARALVDAGAVQAAVGHRKPVSDTAAIQFAAGLYTELAQAGAAVGEAVQRARGPLLGTPEGFNVLLVGDRDLRLQPPRGDPSMRTDKSLILDGRQPGVLSEGAGAFFGRGEELVGLARDLADPDRKAVIISGVGGIGKSALALEAAHRNAWRFRGGVTWADGPRTEDEACNGKADDLFRRLCDGLDVRIDPQASPGQVLLQRCQAAPTLLLLDNLELLAKARPGEIDALGRFIAALAHGSKVVVTLRPPIRTLEDLPEAQPLHLRDGLEAPAARLLARRIAEGRKLLPKHEALVEQIAARVGGHPKMIELIVPRLAHFNGPKLVEAELKALTGQMAQDLDRLVGWSAGLLSEVGKKVLPLLPLFPAGSCLPAAVSAALGEDAAQGLTELADAGLIDWREDVERFYWHQSVMDYAGKMGGLEDAAAKIRLVEFYTEWGNEHLNDFDVLAVEQGNMLPVLEWAWEAVQRRDKAARAVGRAGVIRDLLGLSRFWWVRGHWALRLAWLRRAVELGEAGPLDDRGWHAYNLHELGISLADTGDYAAAEELYRRSATIKEAIGDRQGLAATLHCQGILARAKGDYEAAAGLYDRSAAIFDEIGNRQGLAATLHCQGMLAEDTGDYEAAAELYRRSAAIEEEIGNRRGLAATLHQQAYLSELQGDNAAAAELYRRSVAIKEEIGDQPGFAQTASNLGALYWNMGDLPEAQRWYERSLAAVEPLPGVEEALLKQGWKIRERLERVRQARGGGRASSEKGFSP